MQPTKLIERERTPVPLMLYGVYLYYASRSLRLASKALEPLVERSHVSIWKWVQRVAPFAERFSVPRKGVERIFVDETLMVCYLFLKRVRARYGRKPILTDEAQWYHEACRWLRLPHSNYPVQEKNLIERFMQHLKDRTECFDDYFPCRKEGCDRAHVWNWLRLLVFHIHQNMDPTRVVGLLSLEAGLS